MKPFNIVRNNIRLKARRCGVTEAAMTQVYLQERLIARVANSEYGRNFILKGGLCMAMILGVHSRTTMDSDYNLKGIKLTEKGILELLNEIILIDMNDGIQYMTRILKIYDRFIFTMTPNFIKVTFLFA
jgi:Uncharacterized conserved protein